MAKKMQNSVKIKLPSVNAEEQPRECRMSLDLYQNARMTMGELRDLVRAGVFSWEFLEYVIQDGQRPRSAVDRAMDKMDDYTMGIGKSLRGKRSNVW